ncbi:hypothetical protein DAPPUDRAFT_197746, partial [Daphnia pulex]
MLDHVEIPNSYRMPQPKRAAAEVAEKKASDIIRADDESEDVIIVESKQSNLEPQSSKEKPLIAGAAAKEKLNASKETVHIPKGSGMKHMEKMADKEETALTAKFDKAKKESEGVVAEQQSSAEESDGEEENEDEEQRKARLHKIRVEAGKKAAATRKAHAQGQGSAEEEENEDEDKRKARLHKIRVKAGEKAAATRKSHEK